LCGRSSPANTRHQRSSDRTMGRSSLLGLYGSGERPAEPPTRSTLRPDPRGRTGLPNRSLDRSGMSPSTPSCSARLQRRRSWLIVGVGSKTQSGRSTGSCLRTTPKDSQMAWTDEGGHVSSAATILLAGQQDPLTLFFAEVVGHMAVATFATEHCSHYPQTACASASSS
jgi:hypothetical protein